MWGNLQGWIIAACLVLGTVLVGARIRSWSEITDATDFSTGDNLEVINPPISMSVVDQSEAGDVQKLYRDAARQYVTGDAYAFMHDPQGTPPASIVLVLNATHKSGTSIFADNPAELINYKNRHETLDNLKEVGDWVLKTGMVLMNKGNKAEAKKYFEAAFALGWNLYRERLTHEEYSDGETLMEGSMKELAEDTGNTEMDADYKKLQNYNEHHVEPIYQMLDNINQDVIAQYAGDIYRFASSESKDRMVRVEAILSLGRLKYNAARNADQDSVMKTLGKLEANTDPYFSTAAKAAKDLTIEEYRMIHP